MRTFSTENFNCLNGNKNIEFPTEFLLAKYIINKQVLLIYLETGNGECEIVTLDDFNTHNNKGKL